MGRVGRAQQKKCVFGRALTETLAYAAPAYQNGARSPTLFNPSACPFPPHVRHHPLAPICSAVHPRGCRVARRVYPAAADHCQRCRRAPRCLCCGRVPVALSLCLPWSTCVEVRWRGTCGLGPSPVNASGWRFLSFTNTPCSAPVASRRWCFRQRTRLVQCSTEPRGLPSCVRRVGRLVAGWRPWGTAAQRAWRPGRTAVTPFPASPRRAARLPPSPLPPPPAPIAHRTRRQPRIRARGCGRRRHRRHGGGGQVAARLGARLCRSRRCQDGRRPVDRVAIRQGPGGGPAR